VRVALFAKEGALFNGSGTPDNGLQSQAYAASPAKGTFDGSDGLWDKTQHDAYSTIRQRPYFTVAGCTGQLLAMLITKGAALSSWLNWRIAYGGRV